MTTDSPGRDELCLAEENLSRIREEKIKEVNSLCSPVQVNRIRMFWESNSSELHEEDITSSRYHFKRSHSNSVPECDSESNKKCKPPVYPKPVNYLRRPSEHERFEMPQVSTQCRMFNIYLDDVITDIVERGINHAVQEEQVITALNYEAADSEDMTSEQYLHSMPLFESPNIEDTLFDDILIDDTTHDCDTRRHNSDHIGNIAEALVTQVLNDFYNEQSENIKQWRRVQYESCSPDLLTDDDQYERRCRPVVPADSWRVERQQSFGHGDNEMLQLDLDFYNEDEDQVHYTPFPQTDIFTGTVLSYADQLSDTVIEEVFKMVTFNNETVEEEDNNNENNDDDDDNNNEENHDDNDSNGESDDDDDSSETDDNVNNESDDYEHDEYINDSDTHGGGCLLNDRVAGYNDREEGFNDRDSDKGESVSEYDDVYEFAEKYASYIISCVITHMTVDSGLEESGEEDINVAMLAKYLVEDVIEQALQVLMLHSRRSSEIPVYGQLVVRDTSPTPSYGVLKVANGELQDTGSSKRTELQSYYKAHNPDITQSSPNLSSCVTKVGSRPRSCNDSSPDPVLKNLTELCESLCGHISSDAAVIPKDKDTLFDECFLEVLNQRTTPPKLPPKLPPRSSVKQGDYVNTWPALIKHARLEKHARKRAYKTGMTRNRTFRRGKRNRFARRSKRLKKVPLEQNTPISYLPGNHVSTPRFVTPSVRNECGRTGHVLPWKRLTSVSLKRDISPFVVAEYEGVVEPKYQDREVELSTDFVPSNVSVDESFELTELYADEGGTSFRRDSAPTQRRHAPTLATEDSVNFYYEPHQPDNMSLTGEEQHYYDDISEYTARHVPGSEAHPVNTVEYAGITDTDEEDTGDTTVDVSDLQVEEVKLDDDLYGLDDSGINPDCSMSRDTDGARLRASSPYLRASAPHLYCNQFPSHDYYNLSDSSCAADKRENVPVIRKSSSNSISEYHESTYDTPRFSIAHVYGAAVSYENIPSTRHVKSWHCSSAGALRTTVSQPSLLHSRSNLTRNSHANLTRNSSISPFGSTSDNNVFSSTDLSSSFSNDDFVDEEGYEVPLDLFPTTESAYLNTTDTIVPDPTERRQSDTAHSYELIPGPKDMEDNHLYEFIDKPERHDVNLPSERDLYEDIEEVVPAEQSQVKDNDTPVTDGKSSINDVESYNGGRRSFHGRLEQESCGRSCDVQSLGQMEQESREEISESDFDDCSVDDDQWSGSVESLDEISSKGKLDKDSASEDSETAYTDEVDELLVGEALWDHVSISKEHLEFKAGDLVEVLQQQGVWWLGRTDSGRRGWFPSHSIRLRISQEASPGELRSDDELRSDAELRSDVGIPTSRDVSTPRRMTILQRMNTISPKLNPDWVRQKVIEEIINFEEEFVNNLRDVIEGPLKQARLRTDLFNETTLNNLFGNIEEVFSFQVELFSSLKRQLDTHVHKTKLGDVFRANSGKFVEVYSKYCNNHPNSCAEYTILNQQMIYTIFFESCRLLKDMKRIPLNGYLLSPIQRICQYPLQLKELLKYTPLSHSDHSAVQAAVQIMTVVAETVNERKRRLENLKKLVQWQCQIEDWKGDSIMTKSSILLHSGNLYKISAGHKQMRRFFLFDHQLVYCRKLIPSGKFQYRGRIDLDNCTLQDMSDDTDTHGVTNAWRLQNTTKNKWIVLYCKTSSVKERWMSAFSDERRRVAQDKQNNFSITDIQRRAALVHVSNVSRNSLKLNYKSGNLNDMCGNQSHTESKRSKGFTNKMFSLKNKKQ